MSYLILIGFFFDEEKRILSRLLQVICYGKVKFSFKLYFNLITRYLNVYIKKVKINNMI